MKVKDVTLKGNSLNATECGRGAIGHVKKKKKSMEMGLYLLTHE